MHPDVTDQSRTRAYGYTHGRAAADLPQALALTALALALTVPIGDWPPEGMVFPALIFGGWGIGLLAFSLYRLAMPDRPTLVLSREGLLHRLATDRLIPWSEIRAFRKQDVVVMARPRVWGAHTGAVALTISGEFYDRLMQGRRLRQYLFGMGHFGAKGERVDLYIFPQQARAEGAELLVAVETRWRAFNTPDTTLRRGAVPPVGAATGLEAASAPSGDPRPPLFTPATLFGTIVAGAVVVVLATRHLGLWHI
ncbi:hypothetical protein [Phreatobacter sp.]|uniref:hypothetical protein n=1 Tax=Phreatobacter sp. TaxID=1966341 RepID=UPI003F7278A3